MAEQEGKFRLKLEKSTKVKALYRRAKALEELGLFEDCEADYREICELEPENVTAEKNLKVGVKVGVAIYIRVYYIISFLM